MRIALIATAAAAALIPAPALAWGKTGHRIIAKIADGQLSGLARAHIRELIGVESLDEASTWPDEMRSDPAPFWQKTSTPWHYVTLNGMVYDHAPSEGDALEAIERFRATLMDPKASKADKQLALRFIIHLVGDLHQPMHVGKCCDRGGNDIKVKWFGKDTNLHAVWDSALVDDQQLSFTEYAERLERHISPQDVIDWWTVRPKDWIHESARLREAAYPEVKAPAPPAPGQPTAPPPLPELGYSYLYKSTPVVNQRLSQAGVRLAAYLNALFGHPQPLPKATARK